MLSQITANAGVTTGVWAVASTLTVQIMVNVGKWITDWKKDSQKMEMDREIRDNLVKMNVNVEKQEAIRNEQHLANLREMSNLCKAQFYFKHRQIIEPQIPIDKKQPNP
jgi:hypothetical protein